MRAIEEDNEKKRRVESGGREREKVVEKIRERKRKKKIDRPERWREREREGKKEIDR